MPMVPPAMGAAVNDTGGGKDGRLRCKPLVRFEAVSKTYDGLSRVVDGLDLTIAEGEFLTLLGPSGSGKTTCLMMLAGFEQPTAGEIFLGDVPVSKTPPHKRGIGMVFQNYALFPHMTVAENLAFPLEVRGLPKPDIAAAVTRALAMVKLDGYGTRRPQQLSGGQQQRIAVARALVFNPRLVLMDEPLGALDKQLRERMQFEIKRLHEELGITVVYVTHDQSEALTMSDRIAVFHHGRIQQIDTPDALYERPVNSFVAQFIGENNRIRGRVVRHAGDGCCAVALAEGHEVQALAVNAPPAGGDTLISLRPERAILNPAERQCPNTLPGRIVEIVYLGDHVRARADIPGTDDFTLKIPNSDGGPRLKPGDAVTIGWRTADARALDAAPAADTGED